MSYEEEDTCHMRRRIHVKVLGETITPTYLYLHTSRYQKERKKERERERERESCHVRIQQTAVDLERRIYRVPHLQSSIFDCQ